MIVVTGATGNVGQPLVRALVAAGEQVTAVSRRISTITPKVLTQRLRQLERDGLVVRTYHAEVPPRVEYEISELGRSLGSLFAALSEWSPNLEQVELARADYDRKTSAGTGKPAAHR